MTQVAENKGIHMSNFAKLESPGTGGTPPWLDSLRKAAMDHFHSIGFPTSSQEEWRFTNFGPIAKTPFIPAEPSLDAATAAIELIEEFSFGGEALAELVFVNGFYAPKFSRIGKLPRGATVATFGEVLQHDPALLERHLGRHADIQANPFAALNTGSFRDGAVIHLSRNTVVDGPIHILLVSTAGETPMVSQPRLLVIAEDHAQLNLVNSFVGGGGVHWTNAVAEIFAGADCRISHSRIDAGSDDAFRTTLFQAQLGRESQLISHCATMGGRLTRNNLNVVLQGEGADATLNGLAVLKGNQHCDNHTLLDHAAPNCGSHELFKHVLDGHSTCVFKGKILVRQAAQKTDSKQTSKSLLLSDDARMDSQPELEIYADDVKCTHGSTTGPVDEDMVFYLRSRGVSIEAARHLLTYAFAADITRRIKFEPVRRRLEDFMAAQHGLPRDLRITDLGEHDEKAR